MPALLLLAIKVILTVTVVLLTVAYCVYAERKVIGHMQQRPGPQFVGWRGLLQSPADVLKLIIKEDIVPTKADKFIHFIAPVLCLVPAVLALAPIPFNKSGSLLIADINIGVLYILAVSELGIFGIILAGWGSNSKYSLMGAMRSAAQMVSYEVALGLSLVGVFMMSGSMSMVEISKAQSGSVWYILPQFLGFFVYCVAAVAETNRTPFDLPEAETELVAGFHVEYSGMKFAFFFLAEYTNMIVVSSIAATCFLGGASGWLLPPLVWYLIKVYAFLFIFFWLRATFPRYRYDQLMEIGWKFLIPLALANVVITALIKAYI